MAVNRLLSLSLLALAVLGCGTASMLTALRGSALADMRTGRAQLAAVRSLAAGPVPAGRFRPRMDGPSIPSPRVQAVAWGL